MDREVTAFNFYDYTVLGLGSVSSAAAGAAPLACFVLRRLRRLDSVLGAFAAAPRPPLPSLGGGGEQRWDSGQKQRFWSKTCVTCRMVFFLLRLGNKSFYSLV